MARLASAIVWCAFCSRERLLFSAEKPINEDGITLGRLPSTRACGFAIDYIWSTVYGDTLNIGKDNLTAIGNSLWINGAMFFGQSCAVPRCVLGRTLPMPANRDACQHRMLVRKQLARQSNTTPTAVINPFILLPARKSEMVRVTSEAVVSV
jgi:hypothetical protein